MNFDDFTSMQIDGQEITELRIDGVLVWEKNTVSNDLILSFTGNNFNVYSSSEGLTGQDIVIDWGDGATINYTGVSDLNHTYSVSGDYFITITGITSLGTACFRRCSGLTNVIIPKGVTSITSYCFEGCSSLIDVVFSDTVTSLGDYCFSNIGLTSIVIPDTITYLGYYCFYNCSSLTSVVIPNTVISLKSSCFKGCSSLETLVLNWTTNPPTYNSLWIKDTPSSLKFSIPYGTTDLYIAKNYPSNKLVEREEEHSGVTPTVNNIALTSDKSILSSYDGESATLTATVTGTNVDGLEVEFFNGSTSMGTSIITNGVATKSYTATGSGDVTIIAECMNMQGTYELCDAILYHPNEISSNTSWNIPNMPTNFKATFKVQNPEISGCTTWLIVGADENNHLFGGQVGASGLIGVYVRVNGSYEKYETSDHVLPKNADSLITFTSNNNVHSVTYGSVTKTVTSNTITARNYVKAKVDDSRNPMTDLLIMPIIDNNVTPTNNIALTSDKSVLSAYNSDTCTLTATVTGENVDGLTVEFFNGTTSLGTAIVSNGVATKSYSATGAGDISVSAQCGVSTSNTITIEDCIYTEINQIDITKNSDYNQKLNEDIISNLPSTYKIEFDMKSSTSPTSGAEQRIYWAPKDLWTGTSQPSLGAFVGYMYGPKLEAGKRLSGQTSESNSKYVTINTWDNIRIENIGSDKFYFYHNNDYYTWWTINGHSNYSEWIFGIILWSQTTLSIKNLKIKPL